MASVITSKQFDPQRLRRARERLRWSPMALAVASGLHYSVVTRIEREGRASLTNLIKLADALGVTIDDLLSETAT